MEKVDLGKLLDQGARPDAVHVAYLPCVAEWVLLPGAHVGVRRRAKGEGYCASEDYHPHVGVVDPFLQAEVNPGQWCAVCFYPGTVTGLRHEYDHPALHEERAPDAPFAPASGDAAPPPEGPSDWDAFVQESASAKCRTVYKDKPAVKEAPLPWRTNAVLKVCHAMKKSGDYGELPVLADAVEEMGFADQEVLAHMRDQGRLDVVSRLVVEGILGTGLAPHIRWMMDFAGRLGMTYDEMMNDATVHATRGHTHAEQGGMRRQSAFEEVEDEFWEHYTAVTGLIPTHTENPWSCSC